MFKKLFGAALIAVMFNFVSAAPAFAAVCNPASSPTPCLGLSCDTLGMTTMDKGSANILACLVVDAANPSVKIWKAMTSGSGSGSPSSWKCTMRQGPIVTKYNMRETSTAYCDPSEVAVSGGCGFEGIFSDSTLSEHNYPTGKGWNCSKSGGSSGVYFGSTQAFALCCK